MTWWGIGITAASTVYSAYEQSRTAERAASKQEKAAQAALGQQQEEFDILQEQQAPFVAAGGRAIAGQEALAGTLGPEAQQQAIQAFADSPGQQFLRDQQERALLRNQAAIGGLGGGNVRRALQEQAFSRAQTDYMNQFNRLASISGQGQVGTQAAGQLGSIAARSSADLAQQAAAARASGILGRTQATQQGIADLTGLAAQSGAFNRQPTTTTIQPTQTAAPAPTQSQYSVSGGYGLRPIGQ